jgi:hypothetical protein
MELTPSQIRVLEKLLRAGFRFLTLPRYERYIAVEREGFVWLMDPGRGELGLFGQAGYLMGDGLAMLVERGAAKAFVCHEQSVAATPQLLAAYERFRVELGNLLKKE